MNNQIYLLSELLASDLYKRTLSWHVQHGCKIFAMDPDLALTLAMKAVTASGRTVPELAQTLEASPDAFNLFVVAKLATFTSDNREEYPPGEVPPKEERPKTLEVLGYPESFLIAHLCEFTLATIAPADMEAYAKRYRIPKAKKYAKDVLRLFKDAKDKSGQQKRRWQHGGNRHQSMPIERECKICKRVFTLSKEQEELYESKRAANQPLALGCPLCGRTWMMTFAKPEEEKAHPQYRCPVSHCAGWVDYITVPKAKPFWGCGACGSRWLDLDSLYKEIADIAARYPYRKKCYRKAAGGKWLPVPLAKQPGDYEERVEQEPFDKKNDFVRG